MDLKGSKTEQSLKDAFAGESQARNMYTYFAKVARKEGYHYIAKIFEETADQAQAIESVLADLASPTPMDRVVCGDVGFGKTEVALRAAFLAVIGGRQVALLSHALRHVGQGYTVESHRRSHRVTQQTARTDLLQLAELALLEKGKRGRAFVFYAPNNLRARIEQTAGA